MSKKLINGLKYEKQTEDQLYDLSQWELVDIILAYRKDYKAKEQECEELKSENFTFEQLIKEIEKYGAIEEIIQQLDQLKAENEELKKTVIQKCPQCGEIYLNPIGAKLYETLTEIKEIAEINPINTCWTVLELCEKCDENKECDIQCPLFKFKLILQKISECEGNDETN